MKKTIFAVLFLSFSIAGLAQPRWLNGQNRETDYPSSTFYTGFATGNVRSGETQAKAAERLAKEAQGLLAEAIRVQVSSSTTSTSRSEKIQGEEKFTADFTSKTGTNATIELTGVKTDSYTADNGIVYAFAYVNKYELTGYYNASLTMNMQQLESTLQTAKQLEISGEKAKARIQYEDAVPLLVKVEQAQDILIAIDRNASPESLQRDKTATYRSDMIQALARLAQGVYVFIESSEDLFGTKVNIVENQLKAELAKNGCSFTNDIEKADFKLQLSILTREIGKQGSIVFVAADAQVELYDRHKQKAVYSNETAHKGSSISQEKAGRIALNNVTPIIAEKLMPWLND